MDFHPLFVHFPIALLMFYSFLELIKSEKIIANFSLFYTKSTLLIGGLLTGFLTLQTGDIASHLLPRSSHTNILNFHEMFAQMSMFLYGVMAAGYLLKLTEGFWMNRNFKCKNLIINIRIVILSPIVSISLSLLGLIALAITGGLGGILVYGPDIDFVTTFLYNIFNV